MKLPYLAGSAISVMLGLYLINSSNQQTVVPVPAGPYQSQYRPVSIGVPEPTKGILSWGGTAIALGGGIGCLYMGLGKDKEQANEPEYVQEELEEEVLSAPVYAHAGYVGVGATRGANPAYQQAPVRDSVQHTPAKSQKVSYTHKTVVPDKDRALLDKYLDNNLCKKIAASNKSVIICSPPGTGKTTLIKGVILSSFEPQYEVPEYHMVDIKGRMEANKWLGLELVPGCMVVPKDNDYYCVGDKVSHVASIMRARYDGDKRRHPVCLILDDYLATYTIINKQKSYAEMRDQIDIDLIQIISLGREVNVKVMIITQSPNVDELGLSAPVRDNGAMIILGRIDSSKPDREDGGFGAISKQLSMQQIISNKTTRDKLSTEMALLEPYCTKTNQGMFLSTMGTPKLGIVPDLSWVSNKTLDLDLDSIPLTAPSSASTWEDNEPPIDAWGDDSYTEEGD